MIRRSVAVLAKDSQRTIVRDPRAKRLPAVRLEQKGDQTPANTPDERPFLPFQPSRQNQETVGSSLGSYMLAGAGVAIGFSIVGAVLGGF
jgi:hypothetical protein